MTIESNFGSSMIENGFVEQKIKQLIPAPDGWFAEMRGTDADPKTGISHVRVFGFALVERLSDGITSGCWDRYDAIVPVGGRDCDILDLANNYVGVTYIPKGMQPNGVE